MILCSPKFCLTSISPSYTGAAKMSGDHQTGLAEAPPLIFIMIVRA
jgi:hypothetical protein